MTRRFEGGTLVFATHNHGKLEEMLDLTSDLGIELISAGSLGLPIPDEPEETFVGNAIIKAVAAAERSGLPAIADDSGLCVDALDGAPGVRSADWAEIVGGRDFDHAMRRVHEALRDSGAAAPWTARFRCALALAWPDGHTEVAEGEVGGQIVWPGRGSAGHGYDPIFVPDGSTLSYGEMDRWVKNRQSHRADALAKLRKLCFT